MQLGRLGSLIGFAIGCIGGGIQMALPDPKFYGWLLISVGSATFAISLSWWALSNYRLRLPWISREREISSGGHFTKDDPATEKRAIFDHPALATSTIRPELRNHLEHIGFVGGHALRLIANAPVGLQETALKTKLRHDGFAELDGLYGFLRGEIGLITHDPVSGNWLIPSQWQTELAGALASKANDQISGPSASRMTPTKSANKFLTNKFVYGGSSVQKILPRFQAEATTGLKGLRVFVDQRHYVPAIGSVQWSTRRRLLIKEFPVVSRNEPILVQLVTSFEERGSKLWRWGDGGLPHDTNFLYYPNGTYKARVAVVNASDDETYCYFIANGMETDGKDCPPLPRVIGQHMFDFATEWEAEDEKKA